MADPNSNLFAPPTEAELRAAAHPQPKLDSAPPGDLFAPPSQQELDSVLTAPPSEDELRSVGADPARDDSARADAAGVATDPIGNAESGQPVQGEDIDKLAKRRPEFNLSDEELEYIAAKHGVDRKFLQDAVGWYGALHAPGSEVDDGSIGTYLKETGKLAAGTVMNIAGAGIPQGLYKKFAVDDESQRRALDDLERLIEEKKPGAMTAAEMGAGLLVPMSAAGKIGKAGSTAQKVAHGVEAVGLGGAIGYAHSNEDNERLSTALGAGIGAAFAGGAAYFARRAERAASKAQRAAEQAAESGASPEVAHGVEQAVVAADREVVDDSVARARARMTEMAEPEAALQRAVVESPAVREAAQTKNIQQFMDATTPEQRSAIAKLADAAEELDARKVAAYGEDALRAWEVTQDAAQQLVKRVGDDVDGVAAREGAEQLAKVYRDQRESKYVADAIADLGSRGPEGAAASGARAAKDFFSDFRYVTDSLDGRHRSRLTPILDRLSEQFNRFSGDFVAAAKDGKGLEKLILRAERQTAPNGGKFDLAEAVEAAPEVLAQYTKDQQVAVHAWRNAVEEARLKANELGLPITRAEGHGYFPRMARDPVKYLLELDQMARELKFDAGAIAKLKEGAAVPPDAAANAGKLLAAARRGSEEGAASADRAAADYIKGLEYASNMPARTVEQLAAALRQSENLQHVSSALSTRANATFQRGETQLPARLRETDPLKVWMKWNHNTFRHARLRGELQELRSAADAIRRADPQGAERIDTLVRDMVGVREGSMAAAQGRWLAQKQLGWARRAAALPEGPRKGFAMMMAELPNQIVGMSHNIYPFALGARPDKVIENLTSPLFVGIPSTGAKAVRHWVGAYADFTKDVIRNGFNLHKMERELIARGLMPPDQPMEAHRWIHEGIERSLAKWATRGVLDGAAKFALYAYRRTDAITRGVTLRASERIAANLAHDPALRSDLLERAGHGTANAIREALQSGNQEAVVTEVARWLNGYTQFNYNRASMSEYGRTMGGLFSTFTKWPTSVLGEFGQRIERGQMEGRLSPELTRLTLKYFGPLLALRMVGASIMASDGYSARDVAVAAATGKAWDTVAQDHPRIMALVGADPERWAPIGAAGTPDKMLTAGPVPKAAFSMWKAVTEGDAKAAASSLGHTLASFAPGNWVLRLYYQDIPAYKGEGRSRERPEQLLFDDLVDD